MAMYVVRGRGVRVVTARSQYWPPMSPALPPMLALSLFLDFSWNWNQRLMREPTSSPVCPGAHRGPISLKETEALVMGFWGLTLKGSRES